MAVFYSKNDSPTPGMYLVAQSCTTNANGQCIEDPNLETRLYTVVVSATDAAGNSSSDTCKVLILPQNGNVMGDVSTTTQLFLLDEYSTVI